MKNEILPNTQAEMLVNNVLLDSILKELEQNAMEMVIHSKPDDDETKRSCVNEIRAIRNLRQKLVELAKEKTNSSVSGNVA